MDTTRFLEYTGKFSIRSRVFFKAEWKYSSFFLSGYGCFYSLSKTKVTAKSVFGFYSRRFIRIIPAWFFIALFSAALKYFFAGVAFHDGLSQFSLLAFFTKGSLGCWFISVILVLYLVSPFFYELLKRSAGIYKLVCTLIFVASAAVIMFWLGMYAADKVSRDQNAVSVLSKRQLSVLLCLGILLFAAATIFEWKFYARLLHGYCSCRSHMLRLFC